MCSVFFDDLLCLYAKVFWYLCPRVRVPLAACLWRPGAGLGAGIVVRGRGARERFTRPGDDSLAIDGNLVMPPLLIGIDFRLQL